MRRGGLVVSTLCSQPIHDGFESSSCTSLYHHVISLGQDSNPSCIGCEQSVLTTRPPRPTSRQSAYSTTMSRTGSWNTQVCTSYSYFWTAPILRHAANQYYCCLWFPISCLL